MAIVYPDIETIKSGNIEITPGEKKLIEYLMNNLDENYNIYIHPYINGDEPDIVVMSTNMEL